MVFGAKDNMKNKLGRMTCRLCRVFSHARAVFVDFTTGSASAAPVASATRACSAREEQAARLLGALMAANVLNSERAVDASVQVVRAFVKLRHLLASRADLARKVEALDTENPKKYGVFMFSMRSKN